MKKKIILSLVFGIVFFPIDAKRKRTVSIELIEDTYNGKLFSYRLDVVNGTSKEQWTIDGQGCDRDTYESTLLAQMMEEQKRNREQEYQKRIEKVAFKQEQKKVVQKKLIKRAIAKIEEQCDFFKEYGLNDYIAFDDTTIASEIDFLNIPTHYIQPAKHYIDSEYEDFSSEKAEEFFETLQSYSKKLALLSDNTVKKAIDQCEDTEQLKKLLTVVS